LGPESFDVVISTEMIEHVLDWRRVLNNLKHVVRRGGTLLITTRSRGAVYHGYPYDFWRYELSDIEEMLRDFNVEALESDPYGYGVFVKATKPMNYIEADLNDIRLYSIVARRRMHSLSAPSLRVAERFLRHPVHGAILNSVRSVRRWRAGAGLGTTTAA
jgi:SAM-dependent methyltransferase